MVFDSILWFVQIRPDSELANKRSVAPSGPLVADRWTGRRSSSQSSSTRTARTACGCSPAGSGGRGLARPPPPGGMWPHPGEGGFQPPPPSPHPPGASSGEGGIQIFDQLGSDLQKGPFCRLKRDAPCGTCCSLCSTSRRAVGGVKFSATKACAFLHRPPPRNATPCPS